MLILLNKNENECDYLLWFFNEYHEKYHIEEKQTENEEGHTLFCCYSEQ